MQPGGREARRCQGHWPRLRELMCLLSATCLQRPRLQVRPQPSLARPQVPPQQTLWALPWPQPPGMESCHPARPSFTADLHNPRPHFLLAPQVPLTLCEVSLTVVVWVPPHSQPGEEGLIWTLGPFHRDSRPLNLRVPVPKPEVLTSLHSLLLPLTCGCVPHLPLSLVPLWQWPGSVLIGLGRQGSGPVS